MLFYVFKFKVVNRYGMTVSKYLRQLAVADEKAGLVEGPAFHFAKKEEGVIK